MAANPLVHEIFYPHDPEPRRILPLHYVDHPRHRRHRPHRRRQENQMLVTVAHRY